MDRALFVLLFAVSNLATAGGGLDE
jgi:hypothetical protein